MLENFRSEQKVLANLEIAHESAGDIYLKYGNESKALVSYYKALKAVKESPKVYNKIGKILEKQGKLKDAIKFYEVTENVVNIKKCYKKLINQDEDNYKIREERRDSNNQKLGVFDKAIKCYRNAIALTEDNKNY